MSDSLKKDSAFRTYPPLWTHFVHPFILSRQNTALSAQSKKPAYTDEAERIDP
jgi:hypothetical protein